MKQNNKQHFSETLPFCVFIWVLIPMFLKEIMGFESALIVVVGIISGNIFWNIHFQTKKRVDINNSTEETKEIYKKDPIHFDFGDNRCSRIMPYGKRCERTAREKGGLCNSCDDARFGY